MWFHTCAFCWGAAEDGKLFNVMVKHYEQAGNSPPAEALGVSAKFFADGRKQTGRYHVGLRLPCAHVQEDDAKSAAAHLASSAKAAAEALSAPKIVHAWIDAIGTARVGLGFGFARLDDSGARGGKIYIMNRAGSMMPALPMSTQHASTASIYDSIPALLPRPDEDGAMRGHRSWLDSQMVSLEWRIGSHQVILRHYAAQRGETHQERIALSASQAGAPLGHLVERAAGKTETIAYSSPFSGDRRGDGATAAIVGHKVGIQLPDRSMSDQDFMSIAFGSGETLGIAKDAVEGWLQSSGAVRHTVSNIQAAKDYITLYRHPLNLCFESFGPSEDEVEARLRRGQKDTECETAEIRLADSLWGSSSIGGADREEGTCAYSHAPTGRCKDCMDEWDANGFYKVKNKTACGGDVKKKDLGASSSVKECAEKCRNDLTVGGLQCEYFTYKDGECKQVGG